MKIAIAGAGAMGSRIGLMLHQSGNEVLLIDRWPAHIEAIRTNGLIADFNGKEVVAKLQSIHQKKSSKATNTWT